MSMRRFVLTICLILYSGATISGESDFKYESEISSFLEHFQNNEIDKAIDSIYRSNPYLKTNGKQIEELKKAIKKIVSISGNIQGIEKLDTVLLGNSVARINYIVVYERMPIKIQFTFFKIKTGWRIQSFFIEEELF